MKHNTIPGLSLADSAWLSSTLERNRALYGGWRMDGSGSGSGGSGDGSGSGGDGGSGGGSGDGGSGGSGDGGSGDGGKGGGSGDGGSGDGGKGGDSGKGFPADTPVAEMTVQQQAAYWRHQSQKHEGRNRDLLKITGGKYGDDLKTELDELGKLRESQMSDGEKAVAEAEAKGRREASLALVPQLFDVALSHVDEDRRKVLIDSIDTSKVLNSDGTIDTDKVTTLANTLAPADKGQGGRRERDFGGGRRPSSTATGVKSGRDLFEARRRKSTTSS